jgi:tRNA threonylcarbamoyladenosine biosynthesis protein TsaB
MKLLAFDAASTACSAAVLIENCIVAERFDSMERGQAQVLMPMIADVMAQANIDVSALDALTVTVGPGAFTGMRIGLAAAHGLALVTPLSCIGLTTFEAVAYPALSELRPDESLVAVIESKRAELFLQVFDGALKPLSEALVELVEAALSRLPAGPLLLAGDGAARMQKVIGARARLSSSLSPRAAAFAPLAAHRIANGIAALPLRPFYMRPPDAKPMLEQTADV